MQTLLDRRHAQRKFTPSALEYVANQFRPFTDCLEVFDWYREPDFKDNHKELWELCQRLSDIKTPHFELISVWRIVRDKEYILWLSSLGVKAAQLTLFGVEETTDYYTGRKGAFQDLLKAIEILIENKIAPRIQTFINKDNIDELPYIENLIRELDLENRCKAFETEFSFFLHQGSCDGENEKLYNIRITPDDLSKIPQKLIQFTLKHFHAGTLEEVFGRTEQSLYEEFSLEDSTASYVSDSPVFYIDKDFNAYPNITTPAPHWCLGNLKTQGAEIVLAHYRENKSPAQHTRFTVPLSEMVKSQGDKESQKLFTRNDYITFL